MDVYTESKMQARKQRRRDALAALTQNEGERSNTLQRRITVNFGGTPTVNKRRKVGSKGGKRRKRS